jgi:hypothetical protein
MLVFFSLKYFQVIFCKSTQMCDAENICKCEDIYKDIKFFNIGNLQIDSLQKFLFKN